MFDPAAIIIAVRSGATPKDTEVVLVDQAHIKNQRFQMRVGRVGVLSYGVIWLVVIPGTGVVARFIQNPLAIALLYIFGIASALGGLYAAFYSMPRTLESQSHRALILTPVGFTLANLDSGAIVKAADYLTIDNLREKVVRNNEAPDQYHLLITQHGKTSRWIVADYLLTSPEAIAKSIVHAYERVSNARMSAQSQTP